MTPQAHKDKKQNEGTYSKITRDRIARPAVRSLYNRHPPVDPINDAPIGTPRLCTPR